jgi:hypothetical protein
VEQPAACSWGCLHTHSYQAIFHVPWHVTWDATSILINGKLYYTSTQENTFMCIMLKPLDSV